MTILHGVCRNTKHTHPAEGEKTFLAETKKQKNKYIQYVCVYIHNLYIIYTVNRDILVHICILLTRAARLLRPRILFLYFGQP
jgi:hypothetical protein